MSISTILCERDGYKMCCLIPNETDEVGKNNIDTNLEPPHLNFVTHYSTSYPETCTGSGVALSSGKLCDKNYTLATYRRLSMVRTLYTKRQTFKEGSKWPNEDS